MNRFLVVTTTVDRSQAKLLCATLERRGIAVLLERVEVEGRTKQAHRYRVFVPAEQAPHALLLCGVRNPPGHDTEQWGDATAS